MYFTKDGQGVLGRVGETEVSPSDPPVGPLLDLRIAAQQVDSKIRDWCIAARLSPPGATDETTVWKSNYPGEGSPTVHLSTVIQRCDLLVGLDGFHVIDVEEEDDGKLMVMVESAPTVLGCPVCGVVPHAITEQSPWPPLSHETVRIF